MSTQPLLLYDPLPSFYYTSITLFYVKQYQIISTLNDFFYFTDIRDPSFLVITFFRFCPGQNIHFPGFNADNFGTKTQANSKMVGRQNLETICFNIKSKCSMS